MVSVGTGQRSWPTIWHVRQFWSVSDGVSPVFAAALTKNVPAPFSKEPTGGAGPSGNLGTRMHHKFVVIDFDKPTARVYLGSYNFSMPADQKNGENLLLIRCKPTEQRENTDADSSSKTIDLGQQDSPDTTEAREFCC